MQISKIQVKASNCPYASEITSNAIIINKNAIRQIYHNVHQSGMNAQIVNEAYCVFNIVDHYGDFSSINLNCTIDTATFYGNYGTVYDSDTIKTAIFYGINGLLTGNHIVEIAYYYDDGKATGAFPGPLGAAADSQERTTGGSRQAGEGDHPPGAPVAITPFHRKK